MHNLSLPLSYQPPLPLRLLLLGYGHVAQACISLLATRREWLSKTYGMYPVICGIGTRSKGYFIHPQGMHVTTLADGKDSLQEFISVSQPVENAEAFIQRGKAADAFLHNKLSLFQWVIKGSSHEHVRIFVNQFSIELTFACSMFKMIKSCIPCGYPTALLKIKYFKLPCQVTRLLLLEVDYEYHLPILFTTKSCTIRFLHWLWQKHFAKRTGYWHRHSFIFTNHAITRLWSYRDHTAAIVWVAPIIYFS